MPVNVQLTKPKSHRGRKFLESRAPKIIENDKNTLVLKGGHASQLVNNFLNDMCLLKKPLVQRLKWRNPVLPFEDISFIEKMCQKYDCSLFIIGLHSKKRPHNVIIGRLHDGELLDMYELGLHNYIGIPENSSAIFGAKPLIIFSGENFEEDRRFSMLKSLLVDMFKGPTIDGIRSVGIEHLIQIAAPTEGKISLRVRRIRIQNFKKPEEDQQIATKPLRTPAGKPVDISIEDSGPSVNFELRRVTIPSEDKWKRAHRVPPETRIAKKTPKNRHIDVFGSKVGRVHVGKPEKLDTLRPSASLRTALTGHRKRGFERPVGSKKVDRNSGKSTNTTKRRKIST